MPSFGDILKDKEIPWVRHWIDATFEFSRNFANSEGKIDFEALGREEWEFRKALKLKDFSKNERARVLWDEANKLHEKNSKNGSLGGRHKKQKSGPMPENKDDVSDFALENSLDVMDAMECFYATKEREGKDKDGNYIDDWKGYVYKWCKTREKNREKEKRK